MTTRKFLLLLGVVLSVSTRTEASLETAVVGVASGFESSVAQLSAVAVGPRLWPGAPRRIQDADAIVSWDAYLREHAGLIAAGSLKPLVSAPTADVDLAPLLNKQLKTSLRYVLGGRTVWFGGVFDREQNAYLSLLVEGEAPRYYNVRGLLDREERVKIGSAVYQISLSANIFNRVKSEIHFENVDNQGERGSFTLKKMVEALAAEGVPVTLSGQFYRVFYTDGLKAGRSDPAARLFTFLTQEPNGDLRLYFIPVELVPAGRIAAFKMYEDRDVGLSQRDGRLKIYEKP